ncbi:MAG TPA: M1 family aminopeptidase [Geothrix sp.]|nr:M1 family aminopeptidase [Geothrix sp.]
MTSLGFRLVRILLILGLCLAGPRLTGQANSPFVPVEGYKLGQVRTLAQQSSFTVGHARIDFSGNWAPLLRGEQKTGFYLEGNGSLTYISAFEPEWPIFERNAKDMGGVVPFKGNGTRGVSISFTRARILLAGAPLPGWDGGTAMESMPSYQAFAESWQKVDGHFPLHALTAQALNNPGQVVAYIEVEGKDRRWLYHLDGVEAQEEGLEVLRPFRGFGVEYKDWQYSVPLSRQYPQRDPRKDPSPVHFRVSGLDVDLRTADNRQAEMVVQETLIPLEGGMRVFTFDLWTSLVTPEDVRHLKIKQVTDGAGNALAFSHSHDSLAVCYPTPATRGVPLHLRVEYAGDFLIQPEGKNFWQLGVKAGWYPTPSGYASELYTFHATVRTKGEWSAFLPGDTVRRGKDGEWNIVETRTDKPICWTTILGGKYFVEEETSDGLTVRIATYGFKPGSVNKTFFAQAHNIVRYYQNFLGPFPFKEFLIVEKNEWGYGQAPPGMMYITRDAFEQGKNIRAAEDVAGVIGRYTPRSISIHTMDVRHTMAHEMAHQYWGTVVKMPSAHDQWITESFADYCAALYDRDFKSKGHYDKCVAGWKSEGERASDKGPIPLANDLRFDDGYEAFRTRTGLLYSKGPSLLYALHQELGDQVFLTWLKSTQTNFRWKFASTFQIFDLLKFITKKDYTPFVNDYFWGLKMPPVKP